MTTTPDDRRDDEQNPVSGPEPSPGTPDQPPAEPYAPPSYGTPDAAGGGYAAPSYGTPPEPSTDAYPPPSYGTPTEQPYAPPGYGTPTDQPYAPPGYGATPTARPYSASGPTGWPTDQPYGSPGSGQQQPPWGTSYGAPTGAPGQQGWPGAGAQPGYPAAPFPGAAGAYPAPYGSGMPPLATWGKRALGALLDFIVPGMVLSSLLSSIFRVQPGEVNWASNIGTLLIYLALAAYSAKTGQTWGRQVARTQLVGADGRPIGLGKSFLRYILHLVDSIPLLIGWLWPLWDAKRQTFADKIMGTYVVDVSQTGPVNVER